MKSKLLCLALALGLAITGCKSAPLTPEAGAQKFTLQLREAVSANVTDQARKEQMLALVDQMEAVQSDFNRDVTAFVGSFRQLNTSYDTPRSDFDALFKTYDTQRIQARNRFLDVHFQLTALATADEWKRIGKVEKKIYQELLKPRQAPEVAS